MSSLSTRPPLDHPEADSPVEADRSLDELRWLLLAPEQQQIEALRHRLDDPRQKAEELSGCLAEALAIRSRQDHKLQATLQPLIEGALRVEAARNPQRFAAFIATVLGRALISAVSSSIRRGSARLNHILGHALSLESLRWRFKSWHSGHPFTAVALTSSRRYRVEQAFVLDRKTGRFIGQTGITQDLDQQLVAAIEVLYQAAGGGGLHEERPIQGRPPEPFEYGEQTLWLRHGPSITLVAVVSGYPPGGLGRQLEIEVEIIEQMFGPYLGMLDDDAEVAVALESHLQGCLLLGRRKTGAKTSFRLVWAVTAALGLAVTVFVGWRILDNHRWAQYTGRLRSEPGIVVIETRRGWTGYSIHGLRDPSATDPLADLAGRGIPVIQVSEQWEPYLSLDPVIVARRSRQAPDNTARIIEKRAAPD